LIHQVLSELCARNRGHKASKTFKLPANDERSDMLQAHFDWDVF
jgi:hypothetical protein